MSIELNQSDDNDTQISFKILASEPLTYEGKPLTLDLIKRIEAEIAEIDEIDDALIQTNQTILVTLVGECYHADTLIEIELQALAILASIVDSSLTPIEV